MEHGTVQEQIERALKPLVTDRAIMRRVSREIEKRIRFLRWKPPPDFFEFERKFSHVVKHFESKGLTRANYSHAAVKEPSLFYWKPETIIANIEIVAAELETDGVTQEAYLRAILKHPRVLIMRPETVLSHLLEAIECFRSDGITREVYLRAALRQPVLFLLNGDGISNNIARVVKHFGPQELTRADYLQAALKQPNLFYWQPKTIISNIERFVDHFRSHGLTCRAYIRAALKHPPLFSQTPDTLIGHVDRIMELKHRGMIEFKRVPIPQQDSDADVIAFVLRNPRILSCADENLALREIYARVAHPGASPSLLRKSRRDIERQLMKALDHEDQADPVHKIDASSGLGPHSRNLLLRALIREGWIKGRLE